MTMSIINVSLPNRFKSQPVSTFSFHVEICFRKSQRNDSSLNRNNFEIQQQVEKQSFAFQQSKSRTNAIPWSNAEGQITVRVDFVFVFLVESFWIKLFRFWVVFGVSVDAINWYPYGLTSSYQERFFARIHRFDRVRFGTDSV